LLNSITYKFMCICPVFFMVSHLRWHFFDSCLFYCL